MILPFSRAMAELRAASETRGVDMHWHRGAGPCADQHRQSKVWISIGEAKKSNAKRSGGMAGPGTEQKGTATAQHGVEMRRHSRGMC